MTKEERIEVAKTLGLNIQDRLFAMIHDCETFIYLQLEKQREYNNASHSLGIGGGNFLIALGLFSAIDFIAVCNYVYKYGYLGRQDKREKYKKLNKEQEVKDAKKVLRDNYLILEKSLNTTSAFTKLIESAFPEWNLSEEVLTNFWDNYRHALVHLSVPRMRIVLNTSKYNNYEDYINEPDKKKCPIIIAGDSSNWIVLDALALLHNVKYLIGWLQKEIMDGDAEKLGQIIKYIDDNTIPKHIKKKEKSS